MGSEIGWPTRAWVPAELTLTVDPSLLASRRSTAGERQTFPVQTARIENSSRVINYFPRTSSCPGSAPTCQPGNGFSSNAFDEAKDVQPSSQERWPGPQTPSIDQACPRASSTKAPDPTWSA